MMIDAIDVAIAEASAALDEIAEIEDRECAIQRCGAIVKAWTQVEHHIADIRRRADRQALSILHAARCREDA